MTFDQFVGMQFEGWLDRTAALLMSAIAGVAILVTLSAVGSAEWVTHAALNALGATAAKFGTTGFDPAKAGGYLHTSVGRAVVGKNGALTKFFGQNGANAVNAAGGLPDDLSTFLRDRSATTPLQQAISNEDRSCVGLGGGSGGPPVVAGCLSSSFATASAVSRKLANLSAMNVRGCWCSPSIAA